MIAQSMLPEFDYEAATTRKVLQRIPADKLDFRPHEKSFTMGALATHLANLVGWTVPTLHQDLLDIEPNGVPWREPAFESLDAVLAAFDKNVAGAREALAAATDQQMMATWSLAKNGTVVMAMPRVAVMRSFVLNHIVHHRGQMSVYLRLAGTEVPSIYGPSADDPGGM
jgi:uncharacterized damage-inducible protein DinB